MLTVWLTSVKPSSGCKGLEYFVFYVVYSCLPCFQPRFPVTFVINNSIYCFPALFFSSLVFHLQSNTFTQERCALNNKPYIFFALFFKLEI